MITAKWIFLVNVVVSLLLVTISGCGTLVKLVEQPRSSSTSTESSDLDTPSSSTDNPQPQGSSQSSESVTPNSTDNPQTENSHRSEQQKQNGDLQTKVNVLRQMNCGEPTESEYLYGTYQIGWTAQGDRYEGILQMEGNAGMMRVQYFNAAVNGEDIVDQTMVLASCPQGIALIGTNPISPDTKDRHPTYAADNLFIRRQPNGQIMLVMVDDRGVTARVEIEEVTN